MCESGSAGFVISLDSVDDLFRRFTERSKSVRFLNSSVNKWAVDVFDFRGCPTILWGAFALVSLLR